MSDIGRDGNTIPDEVQANYRALRAERGWTWEQMAEQFERDGTTPGTLALNPGNITLAAWARAQKDPAAPERTGPRPPKRDTRQQPPPRTA